LHSGLSPQVLKPTAFHSFIEVIPCYANYQHAAALQYFLEVPSKRVAYNKANHFFTITFPQVVWLHPAIMEAMIAVATLSASMRGNSTATWTTNSALFHHSKAINALVGTQPGRHITLLVCMLLWLYEQFDNHHARALLHRESAKNLLAEWRSRELGADRLIDDFIAENVEPAFLMGFKITAPVKLCREVLGALRLLVNSPTQKGKECTYDDAVGNLGACIELLVTQYGVDHPLSHVLVLQNAFSTLRMWNHQFENYGGHNWRVDGTKILSYATTVALLVQKRGLVTNNMDEDWQRAVEFLLEETSKFHNHLRTTSSYHSLLQGVALIASW
jgi:hypothetical protein